MNSSQIQRQSSSSDGMKAFKNLVIIDAHQMTSHAVLIIENGMILYAGSEDKMPATFGGLHFEDCAGLWVSPGFVNGHTHVAMSFLRDVAHEFPHMIDQLFFPLEKELTSEMVKIFSRPSILAGLSSGVTTFVDHYYHSESVAQAIFEMGARGCIAETLADLGGAKPLSSEDTDKSTFKIQKQDSHFTSYVYGPHAMDTVSPALMKQISILAQQENRRIHLHLSQTDSERKKCEAQFGLSPVKLAQQCGALGKKTLAVHLISADLSDLAVLKQTQTFVGLCPTSQTLYEHVAPLKEMFDIGLKGILGTDCAASHDSMDVWQELKSLYLNLKAQGASVTAQEILKTVWDHPHEWMGTHGGQVTSGFTADLIFFKPDFATYPVLVPHVNFIMSMSSKNLKHLMINGEFVISNNKYRHQESIERWQDEFQIYFNKLNLFSKLQQLKT